MKKIIILCSLLFVFVTGNAQIDNNPSMREMKKAKIMRPEINKQTGLINLKSLMLKWDTIVTYDTSNALYQLYVSNYNISTGELTITVKLRTGSAWINSVRTIYSYNPASYYYTEINQYWHNSAWLDLNKRTYSYDQIGNLLYDYHQSWTGTQWQAEDKASYTYDANGNMLIRLEDVWVNNIWTVANRTTCTYDLNGNNLTLYTDRLQSGLWNSIDSSIMTYDNNGNQILYIYKIFTGAAFENQYKYTFVYDANGNKISEIDSEWDGISWNDMDRYTYTYDNNGNLLTELTEDRLSTTYWQNGQIMTRTYDANNNMLYEGRVNWNSAGGIWQDDSRYYYTYDASNNSITGMSESGWSGWAPINYTNKIFSNQGEVFQVDFCYRYEASYSLVNPCSAYFTLTPDSLTLHHYYIVNLAAGVPPVSYVWSWGDGTFDYTALPSHTYAAAGFYTICLTITDAAGCTTTYCDSSNLAKNTNSMITVDVMAPLGVQDNDINKTISIYPNPATTSLTIEGLSKTARAEVYDISGKLLLTKQLNTHQLDISSLANGLYFIKLTTNEGSVVRKFVKE